MSPAPNALRAAGRTGSPEAAAATGRVGHNIARPVCAPTRTGRATNEGVSHGQRKYLTVDQPPDRRCGTAAAGRVGKETDLPGRVAQDRAGRSPGEVCPLSRASVAQSIKRRTRSTVPPEGCACKAAQAGRPCCLELHTGYSGRPLSWCRRHHGWSFGAAETMMGCAPSPEDPAPFSFLVERCLRNVPF